MINRVRVVHLSNGTTRTAVHEADEISVQVGHPDNEKLCHLIMCDGSGRPHGWAWYTDTSYVQAGTAIPITEGNGS